MNRLLIICISVILAFTSCDAKYTDIYGETNLKLDKDVLSFKTEAKALTVRVSGVFEWSLDTTKTADWCKVIAVYDYNDTDYVTVKVEKNFGTLTRETSFDVVAGKTGERKTMQIVQLGNDPTVHSSKGDTLSFSIDNTMVEIFLTTNIEFTMESTAPDWLIIDTPWVNDETPIKLSITKNETGKDRQGEIVFTQTGGEYTKSIVVIQKNGAVDYEQGDVTEIDGNKRLEILAATSSTNSDGKEIGLSYDNNDLTHYQSAWQPKAEPVVLEYSFSGEENLNYIIYTPYAGDVKKSFKLTEIWTKARGEEYQLTLTKTFAGEKTQTVLLAEQIPNIEKVKFVVKTVNNRDEKVYLVASCAEMKFYSTDLQYSNIFVDKSYSSLKPGVTLNDIFNMKNEFFRTIAEYLYHNRYPAIRVRQYEKYPVISSQNTMKPFGLYDNVTGISVKAGDQVVVMADNLNAQIINLALLSPGKTNNTYDYELSDGINKFRMATDGLLYIKYNTKVATAEPISVHIAGGEVNGYYDLAIHTADEGFAYLQNSKSEYFDMLGKYVHLIFPVNSLKSNITNAGQLESLLKLYDHIAELQQEFIGIIKYDKLQKNRICIMPSSTSLSERNMVILPYKNIDDYTSVTKITGQVLWDVASLIAETCQISGFSSWIPAQKDLYAAYAQYVIEGKTSLLENNTYDDAYNKFFVAEEPLGSKNTAVDPCRAVPFWQLYIYMAKVLNQPDFYMDLHQYLMKGSKVDQAYFVQACKSIAEIDFDVFYDQWRFSSIGGAAITAAPKSLHYITETNYEMFKTINPIVAGKYKTSFKYEALPDGTLKKVTTVEILNTTNAVAYEVVNMGYLVQASNSSKFIVDNYKDNMKIVAIGCGGERVELQK